MGRGRLAVFEDVVVVTVRKDAASHLTGCQAGCAAGSSGASVRGSSSRDPVVNSVFT